MTYKQVQSRGKLLLSEAILLGCKTTKKCIKTEFLFEHLAHDKTIVTHACALGAAVIGAGLRPLVEDSRARLEKRFPILQQRAGRGYSTLYSSIVIKNDNRHWSRERIARWVAEIEKEGNKA